MYVFHGYVILKYDTCCRTLAVNTKDLQMYKLSSVFFLFHAYMDIDKSLSHVYYYHYTRYSLHHNKKGKSLLLLIDDFDGYSLILVQLDLDSFSQKLFWKQDVARIFWGTKGLIKTGTIIRATYGYRLPLPKFLFVEISVNLISWNVGFPR